MKAKELLKMIYEAKGYYTESIDAMIDFWKFVISLMVVTSLLGSYMIYRYGHIVTELYDSLIVYLNK